MQGSKLRAGMGVMLLVAGGTGFGCAAQGTASGGGMTDSGADVRADATTPDTGPTLDSAVQDSARDSTVPKDSATDANGTDASLDAPPDVIEEVGSPCSTGGQTQTRECGICGSQTSVCKGGAWGTFGACTGELDGGCVPDATVMESCGLCGTRTRVCASDCEYAVSACTGQVPDACVPGAIDFEPDPTCDEAGVLGKARTCASTCVLGPESACEAPPPSLVLAATPMAVVDTVVDLVLTTQIPSLQTAVGCPQTIDDAGGNPSTSYAFIVVNNPTGKAAVASIWTSKTASGPTIDTMITSYGGPAIPVTTVARDNCTTTVTDFCGDTSDPTSCLQGWGGLMLSDGNGVALGPGASIVVYVAAVSPTAQGPLRVSARTESLQ